MTADITLRGPDDVIAVLPYQLGYHPRNSIVAISLRGRLVGLVMRADLPSEEGVTAMVDTLLEPLVRDGATSVILLGYEDEPDAGQAALLALVEEVERARIHVVDVVVVRDGRRYSATCADSCCPADGTPLPHPADVPGVAEFVARGRSPLTSREAVDLLVAPDADSCSSVADAVARRSGMPRRRRRSAAAWRSLLRRPEPDDDGPDEGMSHTSPDVLADAVLGLADIAWRDGLVGWLAPGVLPFDDLDPSVVALMRSELPTWAGMGGDGRPGRPVRPVRPGRRRRPRDLVGGVLREQERERQQEQELELERQELLQRLLALCRSVPDDCRDEAAALCTVTAHVAWESGDGAVARAAVDRARRLLPGYRLARLLEEIVDRGVRLPVDSGIDGPATAWVG